VPTTAAVFSGLNRLAIVLIVSRGELPRAFQSRQGNAQRRRGPSANAANIGPIHQTHSESWSPPKKPEARSPFGLPRSTPLCGCACSLTICRRRLTGQSRTTACPEYVEEQQLSVATKPCASCATDSTRTRGFHDLNLRERAPLAFHPRTLPHPVWLRRPTSSL
jgi:hypothetical protein